MKYKKIACIEAILLTILFIKPSIVDKIKEYSKDIIEYISQKDETLPIIEYSNTIKPIAKGTIQKVLLYCTHQNEKYLDYGGVTSAALYLRDSLENEGIEVDYIQEDFITYMHQNGKNYKQLYSISRDFMLPYLLDKEYDLVIDFHRDDLPRDSSFVRCEDETYAYLMCDIGTNNRNYRENLSLAMTITDKINASSTPIMKNVYTIASTYNQDLGPNVLLIEFGSQNNYYIEVCRSIDVLAKVIGEL